MSAKRAIFIDGIRHSYPVCIAFALMFAAIGMLGHAKGFGLSKMLIMSATIFAVPLQALVINNYHVPLLVLAINAAILNSRILLMSSVLVSKWRKRLMTIPSLHFVCSSTYMVSTVEKDLDDPWLYYLGVALPAYVVAIIATGCGYMFWQIGAQYQSILNALAHIVLPVHFTCLTLKRKKDKFAILATAAGIMLAPILLKILNLKITAVIWILLAAALVICEDKVCGKQSLQQA